ncbi:MAG: hypothetical protein SYR96_17535 [Actinomycetota bacterium]|nr:hypothetical protein [Actinomycetota bacterium]
MFSNVDRALGAAAAVVLALTVAPGGAAAATRRYEAVDLGFGGEARAVNDRGDIAGEGSLTAGSGTHGFLWSAGRLTDLGVLQPGQGEYGRATAVNNRGEVAGFSVVHWDPEQSTAHAFVWRHGTLTDIDPGSVDSMATAINNRGEVVGTRYTTAGQRAFRWRDGRMTELGTGYPWDINDRGQVIGTDHAGGTGATMWFGGRTYDLGAPAGYDDWSPVAINNRGWIVGNASFITSRAYLLKSGAFLDLGTFGGEAAYAIDVNDRGQVVGFAETASGGMHPFLWQDGVLRDLTTAGIPDYVAVNALGDRGQIVGTVGSQFDQHAGYFR